MTDYVYFYAAAYTPSGQWTEVEAPILSVISDSERVVTDDLTCFQRGAVDVEFNQPYRYRQFNEIEAFVDAEGYLFLVSQNQPRDEEIRQLIGK